MSRTIFGPKLAAILDFEPLGDQEAIINQSYHIFHSQKHMFRDEVCGSVIIRSWDMEYPIFSFSYFFRGGHFEIFFSVDMHLGGRVIKMAVICQQVVIWL